jgi:hypothetical protein
MQISGVLEMARNLAASHPKWIKRNADPAHMAPIEAIYSEGKAAKTVHAEGPVATVR